MAARTVPSRGGPPAQKTSGPTPNQTLYVRGLDDKIPKEDMRRALYCLFTTYGSVLDINILKTMKMRGQAHIVFRDIQTAAHAMRQCDNIEFMGRTISVHYAKSKSDFIAKIDGTYKNPAAKTAATSEPTTELSALQASIFNRPPGQAPSLPEKPPARDESLANTNVNGDLRGTKRGREEEEEPEGQPVQKAATPHPPSPDANEEEDDSEEMEMSDEED